MSLARTPVYAWSDGHYMHLWVRPDAKRGASVLEDPDDYEMAGGIAIDMDLWDEFVAVSWAQIVHNGHAKKVLRRAMKPSAATYGNFYGFALRELMGEDPMEDLRVRMDAAREAKEAS